MHNMNKNEQWEFFRSVLDALRATDLHIETPDKYFGISYVLNLVGYGHLDFGEASKILEDISAGRVHRQYNELSEEWEIRVAPGRSDTSKRAVTAGRLNVQRDREDEGDYSGPDWRSHYSELDKLKEEKRLQKLRDRDEEKKRNEEAEEEQLVEFISSQIQQGGGRRVFVWVPGCNHVLRTAQAHPDRFSVIFQSPGSRRFTLSFPHNEPNFTSVSPLPSRFPLPPIPRRRVLPEGAIAASSSSASGSRDVEPLTNTSESTLVPSSTQQSSFGPSSESSRSKQARLLALEAGATSLPWICVCGQVNSFDSGSCSFCFGATVSSQVSSSESSVTKVDPPL